MSEEKEQHIFDVIAVGDTVTDDFIKLAEDNAKVIDEGGKQWLGVEYAGKVPFASSTITRGVGNAANAAVNFAKLGLESALISNLGNDMVAHQTISQLEKRGVSTDYVRLQAGKRSNYHYVLWYGAERTILVNHEEYRYHWPHIPKREMPKWIYYTSLGENTLEYQDDCMQWLEKHPEVKLAFQPGTFQIKAGSETMKRVYARTEALALNRTEAVTVSGGDYHNIHELFDKLHALGPKIILITDGPAGSYASNGTKRYKMPAYPDVGEPVERTGAGDAFASTFVAALIKGYPIEGALQLAPIPPTNVVQYIGAQEGLLTTRELREWLEKAPKWYRLEVL